MPAWHADIYIEISFTFNSTPVPQRTVLFMHNGPNTTPYQWFRIDITDYFALYFRRAYMALAYISVEPLRRARSKLAQFDFFSWELLILWFYGPRASPARRLA